MKTKTQRQHNGNTTLSYYAHDREHSIILSNKKEKQL